MASGEAEPLQYTTTVLRVSIHCEGCKKKVKKVLHSIEGVYKVTVDAAQHKVTVTGSVAADALIRRLNKAGKQATLWPAPAAPAAEANKKKAEEVTAAAPAAGEVCKVVVADKADAKPKEAGKDKGEVDAEGSVKKQDKDNKGSEKKDKGPEKKGEASKKQKDDGKDTEAKEKKGSPEPAKEAPADEANGGEDGSAKKGGKKKNKNKQKDGGGEGEAAAENKPQQLPVPALAAPPPPHLLGPERPHGGFPYYAAQPVMSYNVTHPSASVSYYAPTPAVPMHPIPPPHHQVPYGYPPYPGMMPPPPEYLYGPPGMRSSPPQESYNMFDEENANSCSLM